MDSLSLAYMIRITENAGLKERNSFGIRAMARYWISYDDPRQLYELMQQPDFNSLPRLFMGSGTNLLFTVDYPGCLIHSVNRVIKIIHENDDNAEIDAGAGLEWDELVQWTIDRGFYGLENLSSIPGSTGAAPVQNIGAYGVEAGDLITEVDVLDMNTGDEFTLGNKECRFGYRDSIFKNPGKGSWLVTRVRFSLSKAPALNLSYRGLSEELDKEQDKNPVVLRKIIIRIRKGKLPDPQFLGNAGSFFKNPEISIEQFKRIEVVFPGIPCFPAAATGMLKIPAAWMIEKAGWKGYRQNSAGVYDKQALVLVNYGDASGQEILDLAMKIRESVFNMFGIRLSPEVRIVDGQ